MSNYGESATIKPVAIEGLRNRRSQDSNFIEFDGIIPARVDRLLKKMGAVWK
jgi:hypothetical protein